MILGALTINPQVLLLGAVTGLVYALLGVGLVLVYRATRVINFAYGDIGAFGAALLPKLVLDWHWNFFVAMAAMVIVGGFIGGVVELAVVRRLFRAPRLILLVATIGVAQVMLFAQTLLPHIDTTARYPTPFGLRVDVGSLLLLSEHFMVMLVVPAIVVSLAVFLTRTRYGVAVRAAADNGDAAELVGISTKRISTTVWVICGALATVTAILVNPLRGVIIGLPSPALGPSLLLRALAAGLVGRLVSLPLVLVGGLAIGMVEAVVFASYRDPGATDAMLLVVVLVLVFVRGRGSATDEAGTWSLTARVKPAPARLREVAWVRHLPHIGFGFALVVAAALPLVFDTPSRLFLFTRVLVFAMVALSVTVITGWAGQLSLCQGAFMGLGAITTATLVKGGMPFGAAVVYATVGGVAVAVLVGVPALRVAGMYLAVTTLAFAVAASGWLFDRDLFTKGENVFTIPRGEFWFLDLDSHRTYYYVCLVILVGAVFVTARLRRSGIGRVLIAVRDNENAASGFTVSPTVAKLSAFAVAGALASLAGALFGGLQVQFRSDLFGVEESLLAVAMTMIGGLGTIVGPLLGAIWVVGLPAAFTNSSQIQFLTSGAGLLVLLMYFPGGLAQLVYRAREALLAVADARWQRPPEGTEVPPPARTAPRALALAGRGRVDAPPDVPAIAAHNVTMRFGGLTALHDVSITVEQGEAVGLIGSNGAGKSTLMNVIGGYLTATSGSIEIFGQGVTMLPRHERARLGIGRVFQDARLFPGLTVRETIEVALEGRERSEVVPAMLALSSSRAAERQKEGDAADLIGFLGLGRYADAYLADLSTGTRRITELACQLGLGARVIMLDEPTAGVAQREAEAFGPLIQRIQTELGATILVIEHDINLVMSISDRIYCLGLGEVIAAGTPQEVRTNAAVIGAYLGTDERAVERSGVLGSGVRA